MFKRVFRDYSWDSIYLEKLMPLLKDAMESR
jgi:hypothetical protein